jgi:phosphoheptose isomerase
MPYPAVDLSLVRTFPVRRRENLVALGDFVFPSTEPAPFENAELAEVASRIAAARRSRRAVIWMIGGHVVKSGLAPVLIDLMQRGGITHLASNGAAAIHDFEIAMLGHTSEDVARSIEDGSFGMAEETGAAMNRAIRQGARSGLGLGEALGSWLAGDDVSFPQRQYSLLYSAYRLHIPYTVHVAIGTDIIHQHPECDFAATGWASGQDFKIYAASVCDLEGGVFCNFGSAVLGPEVFLKALSVARNLGHPLREITTANFDLLPLRDDYRLPAAKDDPEYYYRPKKNIVIRPTSLGGRGYHIVGDHRATIPNLARLVSAGLERSSGQRESTSPQRDEADASQAGEGTRQAPAGQAGLSERSSEILKKVVSVYPELQEVSIALAQAVRLLVLAFQTGRTLFVCGNGGSMADALHISGELNKSFRQPRPMPVGHAERLVALPGGQAIAQHLQRGLPTVVLGVNPSLASAVDNDTALRGMGFAQELYSLARSGDVLLGISTSGEAQNVINAATVARSLGLTVIALTGERDSRLSSLADVALKAPATDTAAVQAWHINMYHALCEMLEVGAF